jgi:glycosyltransferase involved in cell wall biosynthesis
MIRRYVSAHAVKPIRTLFLVAPRDTNADERETVELIRQISGENITAEVGLLHPSAQCDFAAALKGIPLHAEILKEDNDVSVWKRLPQLLEEGKFEAVVTIGGEEETFWGRLGALRAEMPVVLTYVRCATDINWNSAMQEMLASGTDRFICESPVVAQQLANHPRIPKSRVSCLALGVDVESRRPHLAERASMRYELGLETKHTAGGFSMRPGSADQLDFIFKASKWVVSQANDWRLVLLDVLEDQQQEIQERIERERLQGRVIVRPALGDTDMSLSILDVFLVNPAFENPRTDVLRAMATGLPICLAANSVAEDLVLDGLSGWKHDRIEEAAAEVWAEISSSQKRQRQFGRIGRELAASQWSVNNAARQLSEWIHEVHSAKKLRYLDAATMPPLPADAELAVSY